MPTKQFSWRRNHFPLLAQIPGNSRWLSEDNETAGDADPITGDTHMRTCSFILAFAFVMAGPSMAGSAEKGLPGVGTFAYHGSPVAMAARQPMVLAAK